MKSRLLTLILALLGPLAMQAQSVSVPQKVLDQFAKDYPEATEAVWEKSRHTYEVEFYSDGEELEVEYDGQAEVVQTERTISIREVPDDVWDAFESMYPNAEPDEISVVEKGGLKFFEMEFVENGKEIEALFDESGNALVDDSEDGGDPDDED